MTVKDGYRSLYFKNHAQFSVYLVIQSKRTGVCVESPAWNKYLSLFY